MQCAFLGAAYKVFLFVFSDSIMICLVLCRIYYYLFVYSIVWVFIPLGIIWLSWICGLVSVIILEISFPLWLQTLLCPVFSFWISKNTYVSLMLLYISWILSNVFPCVFKIFICWFVFSHAGLHCCLWAFSRCGARASHCGAAERRLWGTLAQ